MTVINLQTGQPIAELEFGQLLVEDILEDVSEELLQPFVDTTLNTPIAPGVGREFGLASRAAVYEGCLLLVDGGLDTAEVIITHFVGGHLEADFMFAHAGGAPVKGATFPAGQPDHPLFTQAEMLKFFAEVQNQFLLETRCRVVWGDADIQKQARFYNQPDETIRLERIAIEGKALFNDSQTDLDRGRPDWMSDTGTPARWFQDKINIASYGFHPLPTIDAECELLYSERGPAAVRLLDPIRVPFPCSHYLRLGILGRCFGKEGEQRDPQRAAYCSKRFDFGVRLVQRFMGTLAIGGATKQGKFNPLVVGE